MPFSMVCKDTVQAVDIWGFCLVRHQAKAAFVDKCSSAAISTGTAALGNFMQRQSSLPYLKCCPERHLKSLLIQSHNKHIPDVLDTRTIGTAWTRLENCQACCRNTDVRFGCGLAEICIAQEGPWRSLLSLRSSREGFCHSVARLCPSKAFQLSLTRLSKQGLLRS